MNNPSKADKRIPVEKMVGYINAAYDQMLGRWVTDRDLKADDGTQPWKGRDPPSMMALFWVPENGVMYIGSTSRGGPVDEVNQSGYDKTALTPQVRGLLKEAQIEKEFTDPHKNRALCAEFAAISFMYKLEPNMEAKNKAPAGAQMIAYGAPRRSTRKVHDPCQSAQSRLACMSFLKWWGVSYITKDVVIATLGSNNKRVAASEVELAERDSISEVELAERDSISEVELAGRDVVKDNILVEYKPVGSLSSGYSLSGTPVSTFSLDPASLSSPGPGFSMVATGNMASGSDPSGTPALAPRFVNHIVSPTLSIQPTPVATD